MIGKRVFNPSIGLLAAGLTAIYFYFIYYAGTLMTEPFYITAILASIYLVLEFTREDGRHGWGVAIGLGLMFRIVASSTPVISRNNPIFHSMDLVGWQENSRLINLSRKSWLLVRLFF